MHTSRENRLRCTGPWLAIAFAAVLVLPDASAQHPRSIFPWWWAPPAGRFVVDFGPAGYAMARPVPSSSFRIRSSRATFPVMTEHIAGICAGPTPSSATILFRNGETLPNVTLMDPLLLDTGVGIITLKPEQVIQTPPDAKRINLLVHLAGEIQLTGEPSGGVPRAEGGSPLSWGQVQRIESVTNAGSRFKAILFGSTNFIPVTLTNALSMRGPFGSATIPLDSIERIGVLGSTEADKPAALLGNVALASAGAKADAPLRPAALNDGDTLNYDGANGYASGKAPCEFTVRFPSVYNLSLIRFLLWDRDRRSYNYTVDISPDGKNWNTVANRSTGTWRGWQSIELPSQPALSIRIRGLTNSAGANVDIVEIEAFCHPPPGEAPSAAASEKSRRNR